LLSEIVAKAAGKPFVDVVRESIFEPANMRGSCFTGDALPRGFVETVGSGSLGAPRSCLEHPYGSYGLQYRGTGGLVTNVFDMWKFHHALQSGKLLSAESVKQSVDRGTEESLSPYGLGWFVRELPGGSACVSHGSVRGFNGEFRRYPNSDSCIVVLSNDSDSPSKTVAEIVEGILFPPKPEEILSTDDVKAFVGSYVSGEGRQIHIEEIDGKPVYTVLWQPGNPNGPVSRGYVQRNKKGSLVFYQSNETTKIRAVFSKDKKSVRSIRYGKGKYVRAENDIAGSASKKTAMPDALPDEEAGKFVGTYETGFGQELVVEQTDGFLIFTMKWDQDAAKPRQTVGYVMKHKNGDHVLYHPSAPLPIEFELSEDGEVQSISAKQLNMVFNRQD